TLGYPFGPFLQMALATGQRREEVASMRWRDIDEAECIWTLPSETTKAGRAHIVPLSSLAMEILSEARQSAMQLHGREPDQPVSTPNLPVYVFTTRGDRPISGYSKAKSRLDKSFALTREKERLSKPEAWTIHDLRRTVGTGLGKLGVSRFIIARVLNHADRTVTGIYDRYEYLDEKRHALEAWGQYLGNLIVPRGADVVPMRAMLR